jgi:hypothetical protein
MRTQTIVALLACSWLSACDGGATNGADPGSTAATVGPVDLTKAPAALEMTCGGGVGAVQLELPCLVGYDLTAAGEMVPGIHATECRLARAGQPLAWSFMLPLAQVAHAPSEPLHMPGSAPTVTIGMNPVALGAELATLSGVTGDLSFSRVDPDGRAFAGNLDATFTWKTATGASIDCSVTGPLWGAPGDFL